MGANGRDPWSLQIAKVAGIPIRLHFTFLLLLAFFFFAGLSVGAQAAVLFVIGLFACVALHELGHSLVALHYKIPVASITLYPIGGISRITKRPPPNQELWITLAGPAVNLAIAAILWGVLKSQGHLVSLHNVWQGKGDFLTTLFDANVVLFLFNLIPAFPMDGGRILRAFLAVVGMAPAQATRISASVGQLLAIVAVILVIYPHDYFSGNWLLVFIAFFIYLGAGQEAGAVQQEVAFAGVPVSRVMLTHVETLSPGETLKEAAEKLLASAQQDFPVVHGDEVVGLLTRNNLLQGLAAEGPNGYVAGAMHRDFPKASPQDDMSKIFAEAADSNQDLRQSLPLLVMQDGKIVGMVTGENIAEYFAIQRLLAQGSHRWHDQK
jgi:Zn-dependent protease/predicted transcriptional regulator